LEDAAYAIVRIKVFNRIEALKQFITESRTNEQKDALRVLREWKSGGYSVLPPTTENDTQLPGPSVSHRARKRRASTSELNGL
jgi:hypothetical protein